VDRLLKAVQAEERREEVRAACAFGLGLARDKRAVKLLLRLVQEGPTSIRPKAAWALGYIGDSQAVGPLSTLLWSVHGDLQRAVAWALLRSVSGKPMSRNTERFPVRLVDGRLDYAAFLKQLKPRVEPVGATQVSTALRVAGKALAGGLDEVLQRHRDLVLRVLRTLDHHPHRVTLGPLLGGRVDRSSTTSERLLTPLKRVLRQRLGGLVRHRDADVRAHALRLAAKVDLPDAVAAIRQGLLDSQSVVRRAAGGAAVIVARRQPARRPVLVQVLTRRLDSLPWHEQLERLARLGQLRAAGAIPVLRRFARKAHGFLAQYAVRALGHIGGRQVLPELRRALSYPAAKVRIEAIWALCRVDRRAARSALRRVVRRDPSGEVRRAAKQALRR
jgi:HEAT repeat protein